MMSMCGVAPEDDDANAGSLGSAAKKVPVQTSAQAKKDGLWEEIEKNFRSLTSMERLDKGMAYYGEKIPAQWRGSLADLYEDEAKRIKSLADEPPIGQEPKQESKSENPFEGE